MVFQPGIIMRARKSTSTFSAAGRTVTAIGSTIGSAPIYAGKGVLQGVAGVFRRGKDNEDEHNLLSRITQPETKAVVIPDIQGTQVSQPVRDGERLGVPSAADTNGHSAPPESGILRVSILDAKDLVGGLDVKPYAVVRIGEKECKTKHAGKTVAPEWYVRS
jgi:hypothetical protein